MRSMHHRNVGNASGIAAALQLELGRRTPIPRCRSNARPHRGAAPSPRARSVLWAIENVQVGDLVWARDEAASQLITRRVSRLFRHQGKAILRVCIGRGRTQEVIEATPEHPFWVKGRGWVTAGELSRGEVLEEMEEVGKATCGAIVVMNVIDAGRADVFNFEVEGAHNYFVGRDGILVHNHSSLDPDRRPAERYVLGTDPSFFLGPNRARTLRLASRAVIGASIFLASEHTVGKYRAALSAAVASREALDASDALAQHPSASRYSPPVPQLVLWPEFAKATDRLTPVRLIKPQFLVQYEQFRLARDIELAAQPLELRHRSKFADVPMRILSEGSWGPPEFRPSFRELTGADFEVVEAKMRQSLRQGDWRTAKDLARNANIDLTRQNELMDEAYLPRRKSPYEEAAAALMVDGEFQSDLADVLGRAFTVSPLGSLWGFSNASRQAVMERGRFAIGAAPMWIGYGINESLDIARYGSGGWSGATSYAEAWRKPMWEMGQSTITNMASEHAGMVLPAAGAGRWGTPAMQSFGKWGTELVVGQGTRQSVNWLAHEFVDPAIGPFASGVFPTLGKSGVTLAVGYALTNQLLLNTIGGRSPVPWEYRAVAWGLGRHEGTEFFNYMQTP
jgi:hypothetical protein